MDSTLGRENLMVCCLAGYVIERRLTTEKKWEKVDSVDASVTLYCVENLREKSEYEFRVYAENPVGRSLEPAMTEQVRLKTHASKCAEQAWCEGGLDSGRVMYSESCSPTSIYISFKKLNICVYIPL